MKLTPLVPTVPEQDGTPRWGLAASAVVHGLLLLAVLSLAIQHLPKDGSPAPSYELMFQPPSGGGAPSDAPQKPTLPPMQPADVPPPPDAISGPPAPTPSTTPDPKSTTSPPPATDAAPPPVPQLAPQVMPTPPDVSKPAVAAPAPTSATPPAVALAPPDEEASVPLPTPLEAPPRVEQPAVEQPAVRLEMPPTDAAPPTPEAIMPQVPEPLPPVQAKPQPRPVRPVVKAAPRSAVGTLSNPMDLSLSPAAPRPAARGSVASRSLDLSPSREQSGPARSDPYAKIRAANASADWNRGLLSYWLQHRYYPEQAAANGDQGAVTIQLTVNRSGRVENVEVISRSGSQWLDMAAVATWRDAKLPPFTNEMREERITFPIPIQYYLIQR